MGARVLCHQRRAASRSAPSPEHCILLECDGAELLLKHLLTQMSARRVDLDLPNVRIAPILMVREDRHLDEVCSEDLLRPTLAFGGAHRWWQDGDPAAGLIELLDMYLLQVVECAADANRDLGRGVALVELEIGVDGDLVYAHCAYRRRRDRGTCER